MQYGLSLVLGEALNVLLLSRLLALHYVEDTLSQNKMSSLSPCLLVDFKHERALRVIKRFTRALHYINAVNDTH
jgi:hypothetical protein